MNFTQAPQGERSFPTQDNPRVVISNATAVSIQSWDKKEVSISAEVAAAPVKIEEVLITQEKNNLSVSCHPVEPSRKIMLTVHVPAKATLEIVSNGNTVEVKEPAGQITVNIFNEVLELFGPEGTALDMQSATNASARSRPKPGAPMKLLRIGGRSSGTGPPFIKVIAPRSP